MSEIGINAIVKLKELGEAMKSHFKAEDIENCDQLALLLEELENEVKRVEEELEAATIKTNVFRHKVKFFNIDMTNELEDNVKAARDSNMAVINALKQKLEFLTRSIQELQVKDTELRTAVTSMDAKKNELVVSHENVILQLNENMAEKAKAQIHLNETRDALRDLNQAILNLEEEMIASEEKFLKEKNEAREKKIELEKEKHAMDVQTSKQLELNKEKLRELEAIKKRLQESDEQLRTTSQENELLEQSNKQLTLDIENGKIDLAREQKELEQLVVESLRLTALEAQQQQDFVKDKEEILRKLKETSEKSHTEGEHLRKLKDLEDKKRDELKQLYDVFNELQKYILSFKKDIDKMKTEIGTKMQEIAELDAKNQTLSDELERAKNSHNQTMEALQREAEECKQQIIQERELKLKKQQQRDAQSAEIEAFNNEFVTFQNSLNSYMAQNRESQQKLTEQETSLNESLDINNKEMDRLQKEIEEAVNTFDKFNSEYEDKMKSFDLMIEENKSKNEACIAETDQLKSDYESVLLSYEETSKDCDQAKRDYIGLKKRKTQLEADITSFKEETKEYEVSRESVTKELQEARRQTMDAFKSRNEQLLELETKVLKTGLKARCVKTENDKFINAIKDFQVQFKEMELLKIDEINDKERLSAEYEELQKQLIQGWEEDEEIQKKFESNGLEWAKKLEELSTKSNERGVHVGNVVDTLSTGLKQMDEYLANLCSDNKSKESKDQANESKDQANENKDQSNESKDQENKNEDKDQENKNEDKDQENKTENLVLKQETNA